MEMTDQQVTTGQVTTLIDWLNPDPGHPLVPFTGSNEPAPLYQLVFNWDLVWP